MSDGCEESLAEVANIQGKENDLEGCESKKALKRR